MKRRRGREQGGGTASSSILPDTVTWVDLDIIWIRDITHSERQDNIQNILSHMWILKGKGTRKGITEDYKEALMRKRQRLIWKT